MFLGLVDAGCMCPWQAHDKPLATGTKSAFTTFSNRRILSLHSPETPRLISIDSIELICVSILPITTVSHYNSLYDAFLKFVFLNVFILFLNRHPKVRLQMVLRVPWMAPRWPVPAGYEGMNLDSFGKPCFYGWQTEGHWHIMSLGINKECTEDMNGTYN